MLQEFKKWMRSRPTGPLSESSVKKYAGTLDGDLSQWANDSRIHSGKLSDISNPAKFNLIAAKISQLPVFKARDKKGNYMYSNSLNRYSDFLSSKASANPIVASMKPLVKDRLMDCVEEAGIDISDWSNYNGHPASNPKYCYEWCFQTEENVVINLWYDDLDFDEATKDVFLYFNLRDIAKQRSHPVQIKRASNADRIIQNAYKSGYLIRVIMQSGQLEVRFNPEKSSAAVTLRELDDCYWEIQSYDESNGEFRLVRLNNVDSYQKVNHKPKVQRFLATPTFDHATLDLRTDALPSMKGKPPPRGTSKPAKKSSTSNSRARCPEVKKWLLDNTGEDCECCKSRPFLKEDGTPYREIHHLKQLAHDGSDRVSNAVAICANCHRELHYGTARDDLIESLYKKIKRLIRE